MFAFELEDEQLYRSGVFDERELELETFDVIITAFFTTFIVEHG